MSTYDHKQVLADYANGKITPEMAIGHSLQHIAKLYETVKANHQESQAKATALEKRVDLLQAAVDRVLAFLQKVRQAKHNSSGEHPKA